MKRALAACSRASPRSRAGCAHRGALFGASKSTPPPIGPPAAAVTMPQVTERVLPNGLTVLVSEYRSLPIMRFHLLLPGGGGYDPAGQGRRRRAHRGAPRSGHDAAERRGARARGRVPRRRARRRRRHRLLDGLGRVPEQGPRRRARSLQPTSCCIPAFRPDELRAHAGPGARRHRGGAARTRPPSPRSATPATSTARIPTGISSQGTEASVKRLTPERRRRPSTPATTCPITPCWSSSATPARRPDRQGRARVRRLEAAAAARSRSRPRRRASPAGTSCSSTSPTRPRPTSASATSAIARTDPTYVAANVTSTILGGGFGARLIDELRVKRSLTYGAWSGFAARKVPGDFRVGTFTKVDTTGEALQVALDVLDEVRGRRRHRRGAGALAESPDRPVPEAARDAGRGRGQARRARRLRPAAERPRSLSRRASTRPRSPT